MASDIVSTDNAVEERKPFGGGSVMISGDISKHHRTPLYHVDGNLNGVQYQDEILQPLFISALQQIWPAAVFHDARPHRARAVNVLSSRQGLIECPGLQTAQISTQ